MCRTAPKGATCLYPHTDLGRHDARGLVPQGDGSVCAKILVERESVALRVRIVGRVLLIGLVPIILIVAADVWVFQDARVRANTRQEVEASVGSWRIATPETWLAGCAVLFVIFFPMYLLARKASQ